MLYLYAQMAITTGQKPDSIETNSYFADNLLFQFKNINVHSDLNSQW